ncbi:MAG: hypothetical protein C0506_07100 [Anaerolinea sp.]|nr:hypothetical protein [Anaerolinea sp.]
MDGRLALYSGAVFAGVLLAGALVIKPGSGDAASGASGALVEANSTSTSSGTGQGGDSRGFVSRLTSFVRGDDDDDEYEDGEQARGDDNEGDDD